MAARRKVPDARLAIPAKQDVFSFKSRRMKATAGAISASTICFTPPTLCGAIVISFSLSFLSKKILDLA
jgi:hypothetical protein